MQRVFYIAVIVIAGEMVFSLPFHVPRFFRPTMLEVFGLTNTQLGDLFAVYGVTAFLSYFPGGPLADRFSARALLTASLMGTAIGGVFMATIPGWLPMAVLYGFWGITTIFLFWAALIRATREWGGHASQGKAFGILDGGRGLVQAAFATVMVFILAWYLPADAGLATDAERTAGLRTIILSYSAGTFAAGLLVWFVIPGAGETTSVGSRLLVGVGEVLRRPVVWAQAGIIICAYCCYKGVDNYSLYAVQVLGWDEVEGSRLVRNGSWLRPVAAIAAGVIADRLNVTRSLGATFGVLLLTYGVLAVWTPDSVAVAVILANIFITMFGVFALRGIYFALLEETQIPKHLTGTAVGVISFVGFTPEIFFASIAGRILDANPGVEGHLNYFKFLAAIALAGLAVVVWLALLKRNNRQAQAVPLQ